VSIVSSSIRGAAAPVGVASALVKGRREARPFETRPLRAIDWMVMG